MQKQLHSFSSLLVCAVAFCLLVMQPYPILHDFPEWMYQGFVVGELLAGVQSPVTEAYRLVSHPVPNSISQIAMGLLNFFVSPVLAGQIWLCLYFVLAQWLWWRTTSDICGEVKGAAYLLLTMTVTLGVGFWNGYINFQFAILLFALYVYMSRPQTRYPVFLVLIFSLLIFFSHAAVFAAFVVFVGVQCMFGHKQWRPVAALLPSLLLLLWYMVIKIGSGLSSGEGMTLAKWIQYKAYTVAKQGPFHNFILPDGESLLANLGWVYNLGFVMNFVLVVILAIWLCLLAWRQARMREWPDFRGKVELQWPVVVTGLFLFAGFLIAGQNSFGVVNLGERFLVVAIVLLLVFFRCPKPLWRVWVALAIVNGVYILVAIAMVTGYSKESYVVARSASETNLEKYVDDIYANSRHKYFNHRLFIYADRGRELSEKTPGLLEIDLATSVVVLR